MQWEHHRRNTFLSQAVALVSLEFLLGAFTLDDGIAARAGVIQLHGLVEDVKVLQFFDSARSRLYIVEDEEGLTLRLEVLGGANVEDGAIFFEDLAEGVLEGVELDALLEVLDLRRVRSAA